MLVKFKLDDDCDIEQEVSDIKECFAFLAYIRSVFCVKKCGNCGSPHVRLDYRTPQGYEYYSFVCSECGHTLKVSEQKKEQGGRLYLQRDWQPPYSSEGGESHSGPQSREQEPVKAGGDPF